jgi:MinD superfamily P-loop ATPase
MTDNNGPFTIAVASGKGGTGKTMLATNLAAYLSQFAMCVLADLDVEEPNDALFIQADQRVKWDQYQMVPSWDNEACIRCGECVEHCHYNALLFTGDLVLVFDKLCHGCYACSELCPTQALPMRPRKMGVITEYGKNGLVLLEGRLDVGEEQAVPLIHKTSNLLRERHLSSTWHVLDSPPGTACPAVAATRAAQLVILVAEPTPFGLHDLALAAETLDQMGKPYGVVINRSDIGDNSVEEFCRQRQIPVISRIPFERELALRYSRAELAWEQVDTLAKALEDIRVFIERYKEER